MADFGIARDVEDISGLTTTNMTVGTVAYAAPEQLMGEEIDGRADQYALAAPRHRPQGVAAELEDKIVRLRKTLDNAWLRRRRGHDRRAS